MKQLAISIFFILSVCNIYCQSTSPLRPEPLMPRSENLASTRPAEMDIMSTFKLSEKLEGQKERILKWDWQQQGLKAGFTLWIHDASGEFQKEIKVDDYKSNQFKIKNTELPKNRALYLIGLSAEGHPLFAVEY